MKIFFKKNDAGIDTNLDWRKMRRHRRNDDMAIYLKDLDDNPQLLQQLREHQPRCPYCNVVLQETVTGKRPTPKGDACSDCYYGLLGEAIEDHPIASGGNRRG